MTSSVLDRRRIHPSLVRPVLFAGAERGVAVVSVAAAVGVPLFAGLHVLTLIIAFIFAVPIHALGVWMARRDPQMIAVYLRSISARDHYVPWGTRFVTSRSFIPASREDSAVDLLSMVFGTGLGLGAFATTNALREYRSEPGDPADLLNWAFLVDPGVVLMKDGSFLAGWRYRGPDTSAATNEELNLLSRRINDALLPMADGWMLHIDAVRRPAKEYAAEIPGGFPIPSRGSSTRSAVRDTSRPGSTLRRSTTSSSRTRRRPICTLVSARCSSRAGIRWLWTGHRCWIASRPRSSAWTTRWRDGCIPIGSSPTRCSHTFTRA